MQAAGPQLVEKSVREQEINMGKDEKTQSGETQRWKKR